MSQLSQFGILSFGTLSCLPRDLLVPNFCRDMRQLDIPGIFPFLGLEEVVFLSLTCRKAASMYGLNGRFPYKNGEYYCLHIWHESSFEYFFPGIPSSYSCQSRLYIQPLNFLQASALKALVKENNGLVMSTAIRRRAIACVESFAVRPEQLSVLNGRKMEEVHFHGMSRMRLVPNMYNMRLVLIDVSA